MEREYVDQAFGAVHHLTVAAYMLQHPSRLSCQGWRATRSLLAQFLLHGATPAQVRKQNKDLVDSGHRKWRITGGESFKGVDSSTWSLTIASVRLTDAQTYCADVERWAMAVLTEAQGNRNRPIIALDMTMQKPFPQSYWVHPSLFCAGHYPGAQNPVERDTKLSGLLNCGIRRIINLIPVGEPGANGQPFVLYEKTLQNLAAQRGQAIECLRMGFPDGSVPGFAHMETILDTIDASIAAGEAVYLHCRGGHGRTSTVVGCYLVRHGDAPEQAIARILAWRDPLPNNWYPFENGQENFVRSWISHRS